MRAWIIASALVFVGAAGAMAQDERAVQRDAPRAERIGDTIDVCINSEVFDGASAHNHYFRASGAATFIHVTTEGLRISTEAQTPGGLEGESSPATEDRFGAQVEALRAAAASNARVRLRHNDRYLVTQIAISYRQRCG
jgi:hypothetical protein